jgi:hypothetical protein
LGSNEEIVRLTDLAALGMVIFLFDKSSGKEYFPTPGLSLNIPIFYIFKL